MAFLDGVLAGLLVASVISNISMYLATRRRVQAALQHEQRLLDRAHAAELRSTQQIDAMLERISTAPRLEIRSSTPARPNFEERKYIADHPADDAAWNEFRGEPDEDTEPDEDAE